MKKSTFATLLLTALLTLAVSAASVTSAIAQESEFEFESKIKVTMTSYNSFVAAKVVIPPVTNLGEEKSKPLQVRVVLGNSYVTKNGDLPDTFKYILSANLPSLESYDSTERITLENKTPIRVKLPGQFKVSVVFFTNEKGTLKIHKLQKVTKPVSVSKFDKKLVGTGPFVKGKKGTTGKKNTIR